MTLRLPKKWVWDFWFAVNESETHVFYLQAPHALKDERLRHWNVSIGHAVSHDLVHWEILQDALAPSTAAGAWDDYTTWTGSIIQQSGTWYMFYTGTNRAEGGKYQRIGLATSADLINWHKHPDNPLIEPDLQWYETYDPEIWFDQAWRDPWVFEYDGIFHAFITARNKSGSKYGRGVVGHASSTDLLNWRVLPPITEPGEFGHLEVPQLVKIKDLWYLFFSVTHNLYSKTRRSRPGMVFETGTQYMVGNTPFGPFQFRTDRFLIADSIGSFYAGKVIKHPVKNWVFMSTKSRTSAGGFIGEITDPMPLKVAPNGALRVNYSGHR
jgi:beta-fructofuranosidase